MNRRNKVIVIISGVVILAAAGLLYFFLAGGGKEEEGAVMEALLLRDDGEELLSHYLLVDTETGTPFTGNFPEGSIYDESGKKISSEELKNGDVLKLSGDGIMLESYPGQYPGIYKMELLRRQDDELLLKYGALFDEMRVEEDPSQLPFLNLDYRQPQAQVCAMVDTYGGYTWEYVNEAGENVSEKTDSPFILQWERYAEVNIPEQVKIKLLFSKEPEEVTVKRYPSSATKLMSGEENTDETVPPEEVLTEDTEEGPVLDGEPGYVYSVYAKWDNGEAEYGFMTLPMPSLSESK